jgi:hypothetical protein
MVNDDPDDHVLACEEFLKGRLPGNFRAIENGAGLSDFNLPKKDGCEIGAVPMGKAISIVS